MGAGTRGASPRWAGASSIRDTKWFERVSGGCGRTSTLTQSLFRPWHCRTVQDCWDGLGTELWTGDMGRISKQTSRSSGSLSVLASTSGAASVVVAVPGSHVCSSSVQLSIGGEACTSLLQGSVSAKAETVCETRDGDSQAASPARQEDYKKEIYFAWEAPMEVNLSFSWSFSRSSPGIVSAEIHTHSHCGWIQSSINSYSDMEKLKINILK